MVFINNNRLKQEYNKYILDIFNIVDGLLLKDTIILFTINNEVRSFAVVVDRKIQTSQKDFGNIFISFFGTVPKFRQQGFATSLLTYLIQKCQSISLNVRESNTIALRLYSKFGFKMHPHKILYDNPKEFGYRMTYSK